jgi:hypothetical protein
MPYGFRVLVDRPSAFFPNTEFDDGRSINNSHSIHTSHLVGYVRATSTKPAATNSAFVPV